MNRLKYIIASIPACPHLSAPILFNEPHIHADVGRGFKVSSAGFVDISVDNHGVATVVCHGESTSLNIKSNPIEDKIKIERLLNGMY